MGRRLQEKINGNCKDCIFDEKERGTWREQVQGCEIDSCSLHSVRPKTIEVEIQERMRRVELRRKQTRSL